VAAIAILDRLGDVEGIGAHAIADDLSQNRRATPLGMLQVFQDQDASAFADHKTITSRVPGPSGFLRLIGARTKGAHRGEAAHTHGANRGLRSSGDHYVGIAALDNAPGVSDGVRAGRAGRARGFIWALGPVAYADLPSSQVDNRGGNKERGNLARPAVEESGMLALGQLEPPHTRADVPPPAGAVLGCHLQT